MLMELSGEIMMVHALLIFHLGFIGSRLFSRYLILKAPLAAADLARVIRILNKRTWVAWL